MTCICEVEWRKSHSLKELGRGKEWSTVSAVPPTPSCLPLVHFFWLSLNCCSRTSHGGAVQDSSWRQRLSPEPAGPGPGPPPRLTGLTGHEPPAVLLPAGFSALVLVVVPPGLTPAVVCPGSHWCTAAACGVWEAPGPGWAAERGILITACQGRRPLLPGPGLPAAVTAACLPACLPAERAVCGLPAHSPGL